MGPTQAEPRFRRRPDPFKTVVIAPHEGGYYNYLNLGVRVMPTGTVKWFNQIKGFGFIEREGGEDLFVHKSQVTDEIHDGDTVEFEVGEGPKGPNAINVRKSE